MMFLRHQNVLMIGGCSVLHEIDGTDLFVDVDATVVLGIEL
jgi:hypothetical protein